MELNLKNLKNLMQFRPTLSEAASFFGTSEDTISRRVKEWEEKTFKEFRDHHAFPYKQKLVRKALDLALAGNTTMLIFALKNYCGWADKPPSIEGQDSKNFRLAYSFIDEGIS